MFGLGIPQFIFVCLIALNLLLSANLHGKEKTGKYNFFTSLVSTGIYIWILIAGGFFK